MTDKLQEKIVLLYLPLLCQLASMFNAVFAHYGLHRLYLIVYAVALPSLFLVSNKTGRNRNIIVYIYLAILVLVTLLHIVLNNSPFLLLISGFLTYFLPVLYWVTYCNKNRGWIGQIFNLLKIPYGIIAVLAIVQYFFSPNLYGFYIADEGMMKWATGSDFERYSAYFRASSLLGSPQILGLSMALYLIVFLEYFIKKKNFLDILLIVLYIIAGSLSGSKSFFVLVGIYLIVKILMSKSNLSTKFFFLMLIAITIYVLNYYSETLGFLDRITDTQGVMESERRGRWARYSFVFDNISFIGEGPGVAQAISGYKRDMNALESYIFQMLYELGIITFLIYIVFICSSIIKSHHKVMVALIAFSMVYVHAFNSFVFFIFWSLLMISNPFVKTNQPDTKLINNAIKIS